MTASRAVRIVTGWKAGRPRTSAPSRVVRTAGSEVGSSPATGIRSRVPHGQPSSGYGHSSSRPQAAQRTAIQSSSHTRWVTTVATPR